MSYRVSYRNNYYENTTAECYTFATLTEIEAVINSLNKIIDKNGHATLHDYYKLTNGATTKDDVNFGWIDLMYASIEVTRYGYQLRMPTTHRLIFDSADSIRNAYDILQNADDDSLSDAVNDACDILHDVLK